MIGLVVVVLMRCLIGYENKIMSLRFMFIMLLISSMITIMALSLIMHHDYVLSMVMK